MNIYINATFLDIFFEIFGYARHSPNKFGSASLAQTFILKRNRPKQLNSKNDCRRFSPRLDKGKNSFPRARVTHLNKRKNLQLYTNLLNCLFYI